MSRVSKLTDSDLNKTFRARGREIVLYDTYKSLYLGKDTETGDEFRFYNTGECTSIHCAWLERGVDDE